MGLHININGLSCIIFILVLLILFLQINEMIETTPTLYEGNENLESVNFVCNEMAVNDGVLTCESTSQKPIFGYADY